MKATQQIVLKLNEMIAAAPTPEQRLTMASIGSSFLMAANAYRGYNYVGWLDGGHEQWVKDGKPEDNTPYFGDKTMVRFF